MAGLNKVTLIGHLGRDPEVKTNAGGGRIVTFSVATSETWTDKGSGERKERTEWHNIVVFNEPLGKVAEQYLKKGSKVYLEGQMRTREWEKDGIKRYSTEVVLGQYRGELILLDRAEGGGRPAPEENAYGKTRSRSADPPRHSGPMSAAIDDDIPF